MIKEIPKLLFPVLFFAQFMFSQNEKIILGKLNAKESIAQGVRIINLNSEKETISNEKGEFKIAVKEEDLLVFSSNNFDFTRKIVETKDFNLGSITINLTEKIEELDEVVIKNYPNINAVSLGILSTPAKEYTPAERRLETAGDFKPYHLLMIPFGGMPFDPMLNAINGRTKKLKKELKIERRQFMIQKLESLFMEEYYTKKLKINSFTIKAFHYYCVEDKSFPAILKTNNKTKISFKMTELATEFNKLNQNESK